MADYSCWRIGFNSISIVIALKEVEEYEKEISAEVLAAFLDGTGKQKNHKRSLRIYIYPIERFKDAWNDSKNYLVTITSNSMKTYTPKPIDLSDVELTEDIAVH